MASSFPDEPTFWPVHAGDLVAGKYRVERTIAAGGMGLVVQALHVELGRAVAIKFMRSMLAGNEEATERFLREGQAAASLRSEHVARVLDVGRLEDGAPFLVLEYLEGQDLATVAERRGPLSVPDVCWYLLQACEALAEAHRAGIVHRDLKPANLFLASGADGRPCIKVLDFGISKMRRGEAALTTPRGLMGSPLYMAPEQMTAPEDVDGRADVWALGAIAYDLCTGRAPFDADSLSEVCARVLTAPAPPLRLPAGAAAPGLGRVLARCLEKDPDHRFANVADLADALAPFAPPFAREYARRAARVLGVPANTGSSMAPVSLGRPSRSPARPRARWRRDQRLVSALAILFAAGASGLVLRAWPRMTSPPSGAPMDVVLAEPSTSSELVASPTPPVVPPPPPATNTLSPPPALHRAPRLVEERAARRPSRAESKRRISRATERSRLPKQAAPVPAPDPAPSTDPGNEKSPAPPPPDPYGDGVPSAIGADGFHPRSDAYGFRR